MYCKKCGEKLKESDKFCIRCGNKVKEENKTIVENNKDGKSIASLVLGIVSLVLSFSISILVLPLSITGLILGLVSKNKSSEKTAGIILNILSIVVSIVMLIIIIIAIIIIGSSVESTDYRESFKTDNINYTWHCKSFGETDYSVSFSLNDNKSYVWAKYDDSINNAVYGTYSVSELGEDKYSLKLNSTHLLNNGIMQNYVYTSNYEAKFDKFNDLILTNLDNGKSYNCYEYYRD